MKTICILLSVLYVVHTAPAADLATCIADNIQAAATRTATNFVEVISSVNAKCQASSDLLKCHRDSWGSELLEHRKHMAYTDAIQDKLLDCFRNADLSVKCMADSINDPQGLINDAQADDMRKSIVSIRAKCDTDANPTNCADLEFEAIREYNRDYIDFERILLDNFDANC